MPETLFIKDFSSGWRPGDDPINGVKNGLLKMDCVELDANGAIQMSGGLKNIFNFNYPADAHTLYSKFVSGVQRRYLGLVDGSVYRDTTQLFTGGSTERAAFGAAFDYVICCSGTQHKKDSGAAITNLGINKCSIAPVVVNFISNAEMFGDYEYVQLNVANFNGAYLAKSPIGIISTAITTDGYSINVTPRDPALDDTQANEAWIFRRGGELEQFYRIAKVTTYAIFIDSMSDLDAIELNITLNSFLSNVIDITDNILSVIGPINGRHIYITKNKIYFSEIASPDSFDSRLTIGFGGSNTVGAEVFLWAIKWGQNSIAVGTNVDIYILEGTYIQLPDGFLDVALRPLSIENPPISIDVCNYLNGIVFMSADGWRIMSQGGESIPLCAGTTDRIYRGNTLQGYGGVPIYPFPTTDSGGTIPRYSCAVGRNKLWTRVPTLVNNGVVDPFEYRMEIYDFVRKYWRVRPIAPGLLYGQEDDAIMCFITTSTVFGTMRRLCEIENQFQKLDDSDITGGTLKQGISLLTLFQDNNSPRNRKDSLTFKCRIMTGGDNISIFAYIDGNLSTQINLGSLSSSTITEKFIDISSLVGICKNWAIGFSGAVSDFLLDDLSIDYESRPNSTSFYKSIGQHFGPHKRRIRTWPILIDTLGYDVTFTPYIDGVADTSSIINSNGKRTKLHQFTTDIFGVDFEYNLSGTQLFEVWQLYPPEIVQTLPIARRFDQVGPVELMRYGKLKQLELRVIAFGGSTIPYKIFFEDGIDQSGNLIVVSAQESVALIGIPKTTAGEVIRIEFGPTDFDFHRTYTRIQVVKSGRDTEMEWQILESGPIG